MQLGLVITESVLIYLLSEHTASVKGWCQAVLCAGPLSKVSPGCGELCQNGITSKKTSVNLSTSSGQSRQRAHQKDLTGLYANTSAIQHTCHDLERNVNSKLTVCLWPTIILERQPKADCKGLQKISWH